MIKSFSRNSKFVDEILPQKIHILTKYSTNVASHSLFAKIKHKNLIRRCRHELSYKMYSPNDDNIIATGRNGIYCVGENGSTYSHTSSQIYYIDASPDGQLLIGGGILNGHETRFVDVWRYNQSDVIKNVPPIRNWLDLSLAKISSDNKNLYGINKALTAKIFDIESSNLIRDFYNE
ncbi:hypothetical protein MXB_2110, partial [Myxobolus squamalis]